MADEKLVGVRGGIVERSQKKAQEIRSEMKKPQAIFLNANQKAGMLEVAEMLDQLADLVGSEYGYDY